MALAFANRSALFFRQQKFDDCLRDTKLALKCGYPKHLKYKIYQRQAKCYEETNSLSDAKNSYKSAINFLNFSKINKEQKHNLQNDLVKALTELEEREESVVDEPKRVIVESPGEASPAFPRNSRFPSLHKSLTVKYDGARGRHIIASEAVKCGTYLAHESPIVSFLWSENSLTHCSHCFTTVSSPVPCFTCSMVVFCSEQCRDEGWRIYHQYECKAVEAMNSAYQNIFVAYRAISQRPLKYFLDIRAEIEDYDHHRGGGCYDYEYESDSESGDTEPESEDEDHQLDGPYTQDDYINFYNLLKHSRKSSDADKLAFATSASLMLYYLKINNYFGFNASRDSDRELNDCELFIGRLLYHFLEVTMCNSQDICEAVAWNIDKGVTTSGIGTGVYNTISLFNHSCCPNTAR